MFAVFYLGLFWAIAGYVFGQIRTSDNVYFILPLLIVSLEWVRSFGPLGFSWGNLVLTQSEYLLNLQLIDLTGPYLITFLIILLNVLGHFYITKKSQLNKNFYIIILSLLIVPLFGLYRINNIQTNEKSIEVVIIQLISIQIKMGL